MAVVKSLVEASRTHFAPAARASAERIREQVAVVNSSPILDSLLSGVGGLVAILNDQRQILAINDAYLALLGVDDPGPALGLRLGESLDCVRVDDAPSGCGTGVACRSCGAAIAIVTSQRARKGAEADCTLDMRRGEETRTVSMRARAFPLNIDDATYVMVFLEDVTEARRTAALERAFFHDVNNIVQVIGGALDLSHDEPGPPARDLLDTMTLACKRLTDEMALQRSLTGCGSLPVAPRDVLPAVLLSEACSVVARHPATGKYVVWKR